MKGFENEMSKYLTNMANLSPNLALLLINSATHLIWAQKKLNFYGSQECPKQNVPYKIYRILPVT